MKTTEHSLKVDLHVHSPASIDYMGNKSVRGYAELVKAFVDEEVDAIAITDHNTSMVTSNTVGRWRVHGKPTA